MKFKASIFLTLVVGFSAPFLLAQELPPTLEISEALARGLARVDLQAVAEARLAVAESEVLEQQTRVNPQLLVSTEAIDQAGVSNNESYVLLSQNLALFGVRGLRIQAARHAKQAVHFENKHREREAKALIQEWFFDVLFTQNRVDIWADWQTHMGRIAEVISSREQAGQISGYDRRRVMRELAEARAMESRDRAVLSGKWVRLGALVELDERHRLLGNLMPAAGFSELRLTDHPRFRAYDEKIEAALLEGKAARHWLMSDITLEAGLKNSRIGADHDTGFFLSARVPLPMFGARKSPYLRAQAQGSAARAEKALALSESKAYLRSLDTQIRLNRTTVAQFRKEVTGVSQELVDIALAAYAEGEMEIPTVIDAYRSLRDAALEALSMEAETRSLFIELERLGGAP